MLDDPNVQVLLRMHGRMPNIHKVAICIFVGRPLMRAPIRSYPSQTTQNAQSCFYNGNQGKGRNGNQGERSVFHEFGLIIDDYKK